MIKYTSHILYIVHTCVLYVTLVNRINKHPNAMLLPTEVEVQADVSSDASSLACAPAFSVGWQFCGKH